MSLCVIGRFSIGSWDVPSRLMSIRLKVDAERYQSITRTIIIIMTIKEKQTWMTIWKEEKNIIVSLFVITIFPSGDTKIKPIFCVYVCVSVCFFVWIIDYYYYLFYLDYEGRKGISWNSNNNNNNKQHLNMNMNININKRRHASMMRERRKTKYIE